MAIFHQPRSCIWVPADKNSNTSLPKNSLHDRKRTLQIRSNAFWIKESSLYIPKMDNILLSIQKERCLVYMGYIIIYSSHPLFLFNPTSASFSEERSHTLLLKEVLNWTLLKSIAFSTFRNQNQERQKIFSRSSCLLSKIHLKAHQNLPATHEMTRVLN